MIIQNNNTIHLLGKSMSYIMFKTDDDYLLHFYFGKRLADRDYSAMADEWHEEWGFASNTFGLDVYPQEYPSYGLSDLRSGAFELVNKNNNALSSLKVREFKIHNDTAMELDIMPSLFKGDKSADTLEVIMYDEYIDLEVRLFYTVFDEYDIIARRTILINKSNSSIEITRAYSASIDLPLSDFDMLHLAGSWGRERNIVRTPLQQGITASAENARGSSGHQVNPFVMIASRDSDEEHGEVYGFSLIYSGNHSTTASVDQFGTVRVQQGINPHGFSSALKCGESFKTPQSVICYSDSGFGKMSREYHDIFRYNLMHSKWVHECRPILINNWEGTYFDFTEERLLNIAEKAAQAGLDLFVLDDGWFGRRSNDRCSLGDWIVNRKKLPSGIDGLAAKMNALGLKFGLWFEPEMISPDSDLYRLHPDWAVKVSERTPVEIRHQLLLDLTRDDVCNYVIRALSSILSSSNVEYVKWDMNRQITDMPRKGFNHEYTLGYYKVMSAVTKAFPNVLFEGCSAGGGRFDAGVLAYMPQIWASDNSDAVSRLKIQYGTSMCYPISSISTHVTASPNHQCGRITTLKTRADVAYTGTFGYELDITKVTDAEFDEIKEQIKYSRRLQPLVSDGDFYRLSSPFEGNYCSWELVSKDRSRAFVFSCKILSIAQSKNPRLKLRGLDENAQYKNARTGEVWGADMLMNRGIRINYGFGDFGTQTIELEKI